MKILYVITKSEIGGAQMHVSQLMRGMIAQGHTVGLVSYPGGWLEHEARSMGAQFFPNTSFSNAYNPFAVFASIRKLRAIARTFTPDIACCHSSGAGFFWRLGIRNKIPTTYTAHSWAFTTGAPFSRRIIAIIAEKIVARYTSKIICVSEYDRQLALRYGITSRNKLVTIHNGVVLMPEVVRTPHTPVRVLSIGRLAYPKEYGLLIEAFTTVSSDASLTIVGNGPMYTALTTQIRSLGLEQKVTTLTEKKPQDIAGILATADIFILLSKHEGFPMTILEAMSARLPVVASRVGGIPEAIDPTTGILVGNSIGDVREALTTLIIDETLRLRMGNTARQRAESEFSIDQFLQRTLQVYEEVLAKRTT